MTQTRTYLQVVRYHARHNTLPEGGDIVISQAGRSHGDLLRDAGELQRLLRIDEAAIREADRNERRGASWLFGERVGGGEGYSQSVATARRAIVAFEDKLRSYGK